MTPLKFRVIQPKEIADLLGWDIMPNLHAYLKDRPDVIEKTDIFCENSRSAKQAYKNFALFEQVTEQEDFLVCSIYLELFEYLNRPETEFLPGRVIRTLIEKLTETYPGKRIVVQWNHDYDFGSKYEWFKEFPNIFVIQFNTSKRLPNDIVVPFWNISTRPVEAPKKHFAGFVGQINSTSRSSLRGMIKDKTGYYFHDTATGRLDEPEFLKLISSFCFTFCPRGAGLSSYRFFEAFHCNTVPILLADHVELPFPDLDYSKICVRLPENIGFEAMNQRLRELDDRKFLQEISRVRHRFSLLGTQEEIYKRLSCT